MTLPRETNLKKKKTRLGSRKVIYIVRVSNQASHKIDASGADGTPSSLRMASLLLVFTLSLSLSLSLGASIT